MKYLIGLVAALLTMLFSNLAVGNLRGRSQDEVANRVALEWYRYALEAERYTEGYRGPVAARMYSYLGLAAYEAGVPFLAAKYRSIASFYPDLVLPEIGNPKDYYLPAVLHACYATVLDSFFMTAPEQVQRKGKSILKKWQDAFHQEYASEVLVHSYDFGKKVGLAVFNWSVSDSVGHEAFLRNYDENFELESGPGAWKPCRDFPMPPLLPHWGHTRPLFINPSEYPARELPGYSQQPGSYYYNAALEVYTVHSNWSEENQWIAEFWSDDHPALTFSPAGRWISITNQVIAREIPETAKLLETYLKVGYALNDVLIAGWQLKYHFMLERPVTFIQAAIDSRWNTKHHTPPFPSYPSGHSLIATAAAEVLESIYGVDYEMTDNSHAGRTEFKGKPRHFASFDQMAKESAASRMLLGVHFRFDCEEGVRLGKLIGREIANIPLTLETTIASRSLE